MQLRSAASLAALLASACGAPRRLPGPRAGAPTEASSRVTLFDEPSTKNAGVRVLHPQIDATAPLGSAFRHRRRLLGRHRHRRDARDLRPTTVSTPSRAPPSSATRATWCTAALASNAPTGGITFGYAYGWESDYKIARPLGDTHHDLYEHNFTLGLAYTHNWDSVCDINNAAAPVCRWSCTPLTSSADCFTPTPTPSSPTGCTSTRSSRRCRGP